jgi:hypothetical protein
VDLLVPYIPNVRPFVEYSRATLTDDESTHEIELGLVVRVSNGTEFIVLSIRSHFNAISPDISSFAKDTPVGKFLEQGRCVVNFMLTSVFFYSLRKPTPPGYVCRLCIAVLEIKEKGSGNKMKTDLGVSIQELSADKIVAIGESTGSDPASSEAKLLRGRLEDISDIGGLMLPDHEDPA